MFNKIISKKSNLYFLSLSSLIILSGCWGKKAKDQEALVVDPADTSVVLLKVNGTPKVTVNSLEADINEISEMDQQLKLMMMFNPEDTRERVFQEKKRMAVIEAWALKNGVRNNPQYQAKRAKIMQHVDMQLDFEQFLTSHKVDVTPEEVLAYYEENKTQDPRILISQAGVKTQAVEFSDQKVANVFYKELKKAGADQLEELAKAQKYFVRPLGSVNETSYVDQAIKEAVANLTNFPAILMVSSADQSKFWVLVALSKEDAKYHDFEKIKDNLAQLLSSKAMGEMLEVKIPEYAKEFDLFENQAYFAELRNNKKDLAAQDFADEQVDEQDEDAINN